VSKWISFAFLGLIPLSTLCAAEEDVGRLSEAFGHTLGKHLQPLDIEFDMLRLFKGIEDGCSGKEPILSEKQCIEAIHRLQEKRFKQLSEKSLKQAEMFLADNAKREKIASLASGKVQYCILSEGTGSTVQPNSSPLIRYTIKTLDDLIIEPADEEEVISLDETLIGLKIGLLSMKEGEKRILYIHPDLAFGTKGGLFFPPNSLLICEVEVLKADPH
jgi:peptidylprolyl isomerase